MRPPSLALLLVAPILASCAAEAPAGDPEAAPGLDALYLPPVAAFDAAPALVAAHGTPAAP